MVSTNTTYTYTQARAHFVELCEKVTSERDFVVITRRNAESVALIPVDELSSLLETAHLLRSPRNAERLLTALNRAKSGVVESQSLDDLRQELGFAEKEESQKPIKKRNSSNSQTKKNSVST
ncbi:type II toxin-antitoxin system Phd/YefM family antitoxin [Anabaena azotica]|uniref:Antitoxin n=1 Tax=Anabaena azotica FACHB-119 TaxID=947527 RepID=A0ABR8D3J2_9NOST|nr:type II toxin-antitoxin system Phd/YefM family antitoxin [Anabaena azotica]MBD2501723.1 type II toxin-antitoxin system Phd/YefM family antitoxin [Anabaena azotica FACHB-119]